MDAAHNHLPDEVINRALGMELRIARENAGYSRRELVELLPSGITVQTLGGYELARRQCAIPRLVEICQVLGESVSQLIDRTLTRAGSATLDLGLRVDLQAIVRDTQPELESLRRWARRRLGDYTNETGIVHLAPAVIREMGAMLGYPQHDLVKYLASFQP